MSYQILQFNLGTGKAQGFVLQGKGEHEGTNVSLSTHEVDDMILVAQREARFGGSHEPSIVSLIRGGSRVSPQEVSRLAELFDRRFLRAHADRLIAQPGPTPRPTYQPPSDQTG